MDKTWEVATLLLVIVADGYYLVIACFILSAILYDVRTAMISTDLQGFKLAVESPTIAQRQVHASKLIAWVRRDNHEYTTPASRR